MFVRPALALAATFGGELGRDLHAPAEWCHTTRRRPRQRLAGRSATATARRRPARQRQQIICPLFLFRPILAAALATLHLLAANSFHGRAAFSPQSAVRTPRAPSATRTDTQPIGADSGRQSGGQFLFDACRATRQQMKGSLSDPLRRLRRCSDFAPRAPVLTAAPLRQRRLRADRRHSDHWPLVGAPVRVGRLDGQRPEWCGSLTGR